MSIKSCHLDYKALLVSCIKYRTDINGNTHYKVIVLIRDKEGNQKVVSGICTCYLRSLVTTNENFYLPKNIMVSFNITNKNKVIFTEIKEM